MPTVIACILHIVASRNVFFFFFFFFLKPELNVDFNFGFCSLFLDTFICFRISLYIADPKNFNNFPSSVLDP